MQGEEGEGLTLPNVERLKTALIKFAGYWVQLQVLANEAGMPARVASGLLRPLVKRKVVQHERHWESRTTKAYYRMCGNLDES